MDALTPFLFEGETLVRVVRGADGEPWFVGVDVCRVLGIVKPHQALDRLRDDERGTCSIGTPGGAQEAITVSEPGLYRLIFGSTKPVAERFKHWLAHDVLPAIRKTGGYKTPDETKESDSAKLAKVRECRLTYGVKAAAALWVALGLPIVPEMFAPPRQSELDLKVIPGGKA